MTELHTQHVALANPARHLGSLVSVLVSGPQTDGQCALLRTHEVRGGEPPRHIHQREDELIYVLEGYLEVCVGETRRDAAPGSCVLLPRGIEHSFVLRSAEASLLVLLMPAGLENFFNELRQLSQPEEGANLQIEQLITIAARYGVEITGPA